MSDLDQAVSTVVQRCLRIESGETVLVVADPDRAALGQALLAGALDAGGTAHVAFGASAAIGGNVTVPVYLDVVVLEPSLHIGEMHVLDGGRHLL